MWQHIENQMRERIGRRWRGRAAIAASGIAILSVSAAAAWFLHTAVGPATAQGGRQIAATGPERPIFGTPTAAGRIRMGAVAPSPRINRIILNTDRPTVVEGEAPADATVSLVSDDAVIGRATARASGAWHMLVENGLGIGDHRLRVRAVAVGTTEMLFGDLLRVSAPRGIVGPVVVEFASTAKADAPSMMAAARPPGSRDAAQEAAPPPLRVAQATPPAEGEDPLAPVRDWLSRADQSYQDVIVRRLSDVTAASVVAQDQPAPQPQAVPPSTAKTPPAPTKVTPDEGWMVDAVLYWLKRSSDTYQKAIVRRLSEPTLESLEARSREDEAKKAADAKAGEDARQKASGDLRTALARRDAELKAAEEAAKAAEDAMAKIVPAPAVPKTDDLAAKKAEEERRAADATAKRQADLEAAEEKRAADAKKAADAAARKAAEDKRLADETAAREVAARKAAEDRRLADETAAREVAARKAAEAKRLADETAAREVAARKAAEDKRLADETAAREVAARKAAEAKRLADETAAREVAARKAAEDRRLADETAARLANQKAAAAKQATDQAVADARKAAEAAAQRAAAEARKAADMARAAEAKRQADLTVAEAAREAAAKAARRQADAKLAADAKAADSAKQRAAALAAAASKAAASRIAAPRPAPAKQPVAAAAPPIRSGATRVAPSPQAAIPSKRRIAAVSPAPIRRGPPIDTSMRSALGAGRGYAATARRHAVAETDVCRRAGRRIKPPGYYVVQEGDSLWDIADRHYSDGRRFARIERANRKLGNPNLIKPCQRIYIPSSKRT